MTPEPADKNSGATVQFSTFYLNDQLCGINIESVQEIDDDLTITRVPLASKYVHGVMNLRGKIVTVIDQNMKLGFGPSQVGAKSRIMIVQSQKEYIGLLVDSIHEVISAKRGEIKPPPSNIRGMEGKFLDGVLSTESDGLLALINVDAILSGDEGK